MRSWQQGLWAGLILALALSSSSGQDPKAKPVTGKADSLFISLKDVINHGATLFNDYGDYAGCYRVYQGALIAVRPQLIDQPDLLKEVDAALKKAEQQPRIVERAFLLRATLDRLRDRVRPGAPEQIVKKPEEKKPEEKKPDDKKPATLWDRLGGTTSVSAVVAEFLKTAGDDPKVNVTRDGKFPLDTKEKVDGARLAIVEFISQATGGPLKYSGKSMKEAHKGMGITDAEFDAAGAHLKKALEKEGAKKAEIDELLKIIGATSKDIVEPAKKQAALWERLGGTTSVSAVVAEFLKTAGDDPKVNITRDGKFPLDTKEKVEGAQLAIVEFISQATGGPLKYSGKSMKEAHKGMAITDAEFDAAGGHLKKALEKEGAKKAEIDELLKIVGTTRKDIVEPAKKPDPKEAKKVDDKLPEGTGKLSGKVTVAGKAGPTGYITLVGADNRAFSTFIRPDGTYAFKTPLPAGDYKAGIETVQKEGAPALTERFPDRYLDPALSALTVRVQEGANAVDLDLK